MKIYIAGKITGLENYKEKFAEAEKRLKAQGHTVINPTCLPNGLEYDNYMPICFAMIDVCDAVYLLDNWRDSPGARKEYCHAADMDKEVICEEEVMGLVMNEVERVIKFLQSIRHERACTDCGYFQECNASSCFDYFTTAIEALKEKAEREEQEAQNGEM